MIYFIIGVVFFIWIIAAWWAVGWFPPTKYKGSDGRYYRDRSTLLNRFLACFHKDDRNGR